jgi:SAM-dependent methyltransferase
MEPMMPPRPPVPDEALSREIVSQDLAFHEAQARLYDLSHPELTNAYQRVMLGRDVRRLRDLLSDVERPLALDVGAGTGRLSLAFVRAGFDVIALDHSSAMLEVVGRKYGRLPEPKGTLRTVVAGADDLGPDLSPDRPVHLVAFSSVLHHLPDYLDVVRGAARLLAPGSCLYITHEPLPAQAQGRTIGMRAVRLADEILRTPQHRPASPPAPLMDYHDRAGLDIDAITSVLEELGCEVVMQRRYKDRKTALMAVLDTYVFRTPNWRFALLARRHGPDPLL